ncbi:ABC transporter permease [Candidatus Bipolaricaulota bacterium]|nr:ABC transporter permease [Candidatus Bipolaricaulota bacterium]
MTRTQIEKKANDEIPLIVIRPSQGWRFVNLREVWRHRELLYFLTWRDVKVRYKQAVLGFLWAFIQPFLKMIVFSIIFGGLAKMDSEGFPYPIFLYAGLLPWQFFADAVNRSGQSIVSGANLITKVYFPRLIMPVASVGACLVDFAISFGILIAMMFYYHMIPNLSILMVLPLVLVTILCALGIGVFVSALNTAYRDFRYALPFLVQIWMFLTPVIYPVTLIPERFRWLILLNPMAGIVDAYRSAILGKPFAWGNLGISLGVATVMFLLGLAYFRKTERYFADIV